MIEFEDARRRVLAAATPLESEDVNLADALDRVLASDAISDHPLPPFDASAMDGFAVCCADLQGEPPFELPVVGESRAGGPPLTLRPGTAARIFTGAELPEGADSVIIQEDTVLVEGRVRMSARVEASANVRRAGSDLARGARVLSRGTRIGPFELGVLASMDRARVRVHRRPRVAVLSTGDELRDPGSVPVRGSIPDSNGPAIRAMAQRAGAEPVASARARDDDAELRAAVLQLCAQAEVLLTVGGVSVGEHDRVRTVLTDAGAELSFWKVAIKPGKPLTFGRLGSTLILGLPGNPVSAQVTFGLFGLPLLRALAGEAQPLPMTERVELAADFKQKPGRLGVYRARLEGRKALFAANQASGSTVSLAHADALVFVPAHVSDCPAGTELDAIRLRDL